MIQIQDKYKNVLLEAVEEQMYKVSLQLESYKGKSLTKERKELTKKQSALEQIQHELHLATPSAESQLSIMTEVSTRK